MSYDDRVDVMDMILKVLEEHEKSLDSLIIQLGETVTRPKPSGEVKVPELNHYKIVLRKWQEFRERCQYSDLLTFDIADDMFQVLSLNNDNFYIYSEIIPEVTIKLDKNSDKVLIENGELISTEYQYSLLNGKLQCGLPIKTKKSKIDLPNGDLIQKINYKVDPEQARTWLSKELKTEKKAIIFGWIEDKKEYP